MKKPTRTYDLYEIVKIPFPFTDTKSIKVRPALIVSSAKYFNAKIGMSLMTMITSIKTGRDSWASDIVIEDLSLAGLPAPSLIRFKLFTLDHRLIIDRLGVLSEVDCRHVQKKLREILVLE